MLKMPLNPNHPSILNGIQPIKSPMKDSYLKIWVFFTVFELDIIHVSFVFRHKLQLQHAYLYLLTDLHIVADMMWQKCV